MRMTEWITVVDRNRNKLGVKSRDAIHQDGDWHETFQCWFIEQVMGVYYIHLQLRSEEKKDFPSLYDITAAGHLLMDETPADGIREIKEELGIELKYEDLHFLDAVPNTIQLPGFIDNEISLVYVYEIQKNLRYQFLDAEVQGVIRVELSQFEQLISKERNAIPLERYIDESYVQGGEHLTMRKIVPHEQIYFEKVLSKINDYIKELS